MTQFLEEKDENRGAEAQKTWRREGAMTGETHCPAASRGNALRIRQSPRLRRPRRGFRLRSPAASESSTESTARSSPDAATRRRRGDDGSDVNAGGEARPGAGVSKQPDADESADAATPAAQAAGSPESEPQSSSAMGLLGAVPLSEKIRLLVDKYSQTSRCCPCDDFSSTRVGTKPPYYAEATAVAAATPSPTVGSPSSTRKLSITITTAPSRRARSDSEGSSCCSCVSRGAVALGADDASSSQRSPSRARSFSSSAAARALSCPPCPWRNRTPSPSRYPASAFITSPFFSSPSELSDYSDSGRSCTCYIDAYVQPEHCFCPTPGLRLYLERQQRQFVEEGLQREAPRERERDRDQERERDRDQEWEREREREQPFSRACSQKCSASCSRVYSRPRLLQCSPECSRPCSRESSPSCRRPCSPCLREMSRERSSENLEALDRARSRERKLGKGKVPSRGSRSAKEREHSRERKSAKERELSRERKSAKERERSRERKLAKQKERSDSLRLAHEKAQSRERKLSLEKDRSRERRQERDKDLSRERQRALEKERSLERQWELERARSRERERGWGRPLRRKSPVLCCYCMCRRPASAGSSRRSVSLDPEHALRRPATAYPWYYGTQKGCCSPCCVYKRRRQRSLGRCTCHWPQGQGPFSRGPAFFLKEDLPSKKVNWCSPLCQHECSRDCLSGCEAFPRLKSAPAPGDNGPASAKSHPSCYNCWEGAGRPPTPNKNAPASAVSRSNGLATAPAAAPIAAPTSAPAAATGEPYPWRTPRRSMLEFYDNVIRPHCMDPAAHLPAAMVGAAGHATAVATAKTTSSRKRASAPVPEAAVRRLHGARAEGRHATCPAHGLQENPGGSEAEPKDALAVPVELNESLEQCTATAKAAADAVAAVAAGTQGDCIDRKTSKRPPRLSCPCGGSERRHRDPRWNDPLYPRPSELRLLPPPGSRDWAKVRVAADVLLRAHAQDLRAVWARRPFAPRWRLRDRLVATASAPAIADARFNGLGFRCGGAAWRSSRMPIALRQKAVRSQLPPALQKKRLSSSLQIFASSSLSRRSISSLSGTSS